MFFPLSKVSYVLLWLAPMFQSSGPELDSGVRRFFFPFVVLSHWSFFFSCSTLFLGEGHPQVATCTYFKLGTDKNTVFDVTRPCCFVQPTSNCIRWFRCCAFVIQNKKKLDFSEDPLQLPCEQSRFDLIRNLFAFDLTGLSRSLRFRPQAGRKICWAKRWEVYEVEWLNQEWVLHWRNAAHVVKVWLFLYFM